jgi:hypothetical protein
MIPETLILSAAKPAIDLIVKTIITPKIQEFAKSLKLSYKEIMIPRGEHFEEYFYRAYKKYSIINTLVFKNEQRLIKDLYIPLTVWREDTHSRKTENIKISEYPKQSIELYKRILITDTAGMGKSTLTKFLFLNVIDNGLGIPIYIEMRRLSKQHTVLEEISDQINSLTKQIDTRLLLDFIQTGGFVFFFDGYDEISLDDRAAVTTDVQEFISKANNNCFIMTSRPEQALSCFGDFMQFSIKALSRKESFELLRRYDNQGITSKKLIEELKTGDYEMISEFLQNPLLVSLLFAAYDFKQTIPLKKHIFYRQVYDAYFDSHDLSKGDSYTHEKKSQLDIDDFDRVLRYVGFKCTKCQRIEFEKDALLSIIDEAKDFCSDLSFSSSDFLSDLLSSVPLFCKDGQLYRWVHKSLQEYFAAQFIYKDSKKNQDAILCALYNSDNLDKYINLLDIYYDIDNWGFRKNIIKPFCETYVKYYEESYFVNPMIEQLKIIERIGLLFLRDVYLDKVSRIEDDPFLTIRQRLQESFNKRLSLITFVSEFAVASSFDVKRRLIPIIAKRRPDLFIQLTNYAPPVKDMSGFPSQIFIKIRTGESDNELYGTYNYFLSFIPREPRCFFSQDACKQELKKIDTICNKQDISSDFTSGL